MVCGVETTALKRPHSILSPLHHICHMSLYSFNLISYVVARIFQMHKSSLGKATRLHLPPCCQNIARSRKSAVANFHHYIAFDVGVGICLFAANSKATHCLTNETYLRLSRNILQSANLVALYTFY